MPQTEFRLYDVSDFPIVRISGSQLPPGYGPQWVAEMDALLARGEPFALILIDTVENPRHEDQKLQTQWFKKRKRELATVCRGAVLIEPDRAKRILKRAQALAMTAAMNLRFSVVPDRTEAELRARQLLAGGALPDDDE